MPKINTQGLRPIAVFAALYNAARPQGMGFRQYTPTPMTEEQAASELTGSKYFDYVNGRVMKLDLSDPNGFDPFLYDRDNGNGAAEIVITALRNGLADQVTKTIHETGKSDAKELALNNIRPSTMSLDGDGVIEYNLGLPQDLVDDLIRA